MIRLVKSNDILIWGPANICPIQAFQSFMLKLITGAVWYMKNAVLHNNLKLPTADKIAQTTIKDSTQNHLAISTLSLTKCFSLH